MNDKKLKYSYIENMNKEQNFEVAGNYVDLINRRIYPATVIVKNGKVFDVKEDPFPKNSYFIMPGFIDSHVHIESSMLTPTEFARLSTPHGTVATISDPHEIGNVLGLEGVRYMIDNAKNTPFYFYFGAPSCVPATTFETSGATIDADAIGTLFKEDGLKYLSEMMNYPGVLNRDAQVMKKIEMAQKFNLPIDGHAPGLRSHDAKTYVDAGISTDHECFQLDEALEKIKYGMKILIREGSAAKNYEALHSLIQTNPEKIMFCSDDKHPHELVSGHINQLVRRSIEKGYDAMDVLSIATLHPILHYKLDVGLLRKDDAADFIIVDNLKDLKVLKTYIKGILVASDGKSLLPYQRGEILNHFDVKEKSVEDFKLNLSDEDSPIIQAIDGELITKRFDAKLNKDNPIDIQKDILKLAVVCRYNNKPPAVSFINGFGLKKGAIGSSVAHDSHNIIVVGTNDDEICKAVNALIEAKGGIAISSDGSVDILKLPIAGLMSPEDGYTVAKDYTRLDLKAKELGSTLQSPFMTLSFMALLVIPSLKLSDKGLFDGTSFKFI